VRINKFLAECGVSSRRNAEKLVLSSRVKVNDVITTDLFVRIGAADIVKLDGRTVKPVSDKVYIILNKPRGCVTACSDDRGRKTVLDILGAGVTQRVFPVGRLDWDTEGLLILTNDGEFTRRVTHPSSKVPKTYLAVLDGVCTDDHKKQIENGIMLDGLPRFAKVSVLQDCSGGRAVEITVTEGRNRQVRRMFMAVGLNVLNLKRISIGNLKLGRLKSGEWRFIKKPLL
jgi:23S rRNA pseudouridine2605 synthase